MAEAPALEAPLRAGQKRRRDRQRVRPGGEFRFASEYPRLHRMDADARARRSPDFTWTAEQADDWRKPWPGFTRTRYEAKAVREGRTPAT